MEERHTNSSEEHKCLQNLESKIDYEHKGVGKMKAKLIREKDWQKYEKKKEKYFNIIKYEYPFSELKK
jgi:hypothetical protein